MNEFGVESVPRRYAGEVYGECIEDPNLWDGVRFVLRDLAKHYQRAWGAAGSTQLAKALKTAQFELKWDLQHKDIPLVLRVQVQAEYPAGYDPDAP